MGTLRLAKAHLVLIRADESVPRYIQTTHRFQLRSCGGAGLVYPHPNLVDGLDFRNLLQQPIDLRDMQRAAKRPTLALRAADIGVEVAMQRGLGPALDIGLQRRIALPWQPQRRLD